MRKIYLFIMVLMAIVATGGFVYFGFIKDECEVSTNTKTSSEESVKTKEKEKVDFNVENKSLVQKISVSAGNMDIIVGSDGNVYATFYFADEDSEKIKTAITKFQGQYKNYNVDGYNFDVESCENGKNNILSGIKLDVDGVISAYEVFDDSKEDLNFYVLFLKNDGTVSALDVSKVFEGDKINIQDNFNNLNNIVTVVNSISSTGCSENYQALAIEKNGSQHVIKF